MKDAGNADVVWDAADLACGVLLLKLRGRMEGMRAGQVLRLVAQDAGAAEDVPAWCRLTGHALLSAEPPVYLIRRKEG
ncbi:MAG: sulfurtransferase TusA family protein [Candidatus Rokuibacteriota bacterium]|nr:MAG: sulfurtransferase TusA family protein [Candidatus Rokubacteria bacterium]